MQPEAVIFTGIPGSGKSTFFVERYFHTHVRISLDVVRTRNRERTLMEACLATGQSFVVDNTNVTAAMRAVYLAAARNAGFRTVGCYFQSRIADAILRNASRPEAQRVPDKAVKGMHASLELPSPGEGYDELFYISPASGGGFNLTPWNNEI